MRPAAREHRRQTDRPAVRQERRQTMRPAARERRRQKAETCRNDIAPRASADIMRARVNSGAAQPGAARVFGRGGHGVPRQPSQPSGAGVALEHERAHEECQRNREDRAERADDERPEDDREEAQREAQAHRVADELRLDQHLQRDVDDAVDRDHREHERPAAHDEREQGGRDQTDDEADVRDEVRHEREDRPDRRRRDAERPQGETVDDRDHRAEARVDDVVPSHAGVDRCGTVAERARATSPKLVSARA